MAHVKWLREITVLFTPFTGFQNEVAYRLRTSAEDPGVPVSRIQPRALAVPPGFPDFMTRRRVVDAGPVTLFGRAWSGRALVSGVDVSVDDGLTWTSASLGPSRSRHAWRPWSCTWDAVPGEYTLCCRAADAEGVQPVEQPWNVQGMANNLAQRIPVTVR
ncbi:hypothetical protein [Actinophytocola sp.]|uniref:hypothetical protein n=1 Tax=Actinophytocola sp. TaxID=1872138 RepID=UPI003D6B16D2